MPCRIEKIAVIGAGVMGAQIAAHLANCGYNSLLLDLNLSIVRSALEKLAKARPPALFTEGVLGRITQGSINDNLKDVAGCSWIIEAVPEVIEIKRDLFSSLEKIITDEQIVTSNTSGISLELLTKGRSDRFKKSFFITHFFNPVRYMKLVELVTGPDTDRVKAEIIRLFLATQMGKGVVRAKDTPGFIANRIGVFEVMDAINKTFTAGWPIDLVDLVMGTPSAMPKSAIFRTADLVGLDTLLHVAKNTYDLCPCDSRRDILIPHPAVEKMVREGHLGLKSGSGFYEKRGDQIFVFDPSNGEYRPKISHRAESIGRAKKTSNPAERVKALFEGSDEAASIAKTLLTDVLVYAAGVAAEISDSIVDIDNAMRWGYNWELGPFELMDAVGAAALGDNAPDILRDVKERGRGSFYCSENGKKVYYDFKAGIYKQLATGAVTVKSIKGRSGALKENGSTSIVDIGDGVICLEFHSKMNSIDPDMISMMDTGVDLLDAGRFAGMVMYNDAGDFSVGANLLMIAMAIGSKSWNQVEDLVRKFQDAGQRMRFSKRPVVAAPFGRTLGGGCEVCLAAGNVVAAAETYMGLVELGVGLIPAGGGCKNMLLQMEQNQIDMHNPKDKIWFSPDDGGPFPKAAAAFETIALARVAASGADAVRLGYLKKGAGIVISRDDLLVNARQYVLGCAGSYRPPVLREDIALPGLGGKMAIMNNVKSMRAQGKISDYDMELADGLAHVLTGGDKPVCHQTSEQHILDLEREVFLRLCGNEKTVARIQHMLTTGRPLRN